MRTSPEAHWLRLPASNAGGAGSIPGLRTRIPHAVWYGQIFFLIMGKKSPHGLKVKVSPSHPTLCNPMDCRLPGFFVHGILQGKNARVDCHSLCQRIFPTQGSNLGLLHCSQILNHLSNLE